MSLQLDLQKSKNVLSLTLQKNGVTKINPCQVSFAMDASGSFQKEHNQGYTEHLLGRILPFALLFDKDGVLDMFSFASSCGEAPEVTEDNYLGYVSRDFPYKGEYGFSTAYLPPFHALIENGYTGKEQVVGVEEQGGFFGKLFGKKEKQIIKTTTESIGKHLSFFITDGEAYDQEEAKHYLEKNQEEQHFIIFVTISNSKFNFFENNYKGKKQTDYFNFTHNELRDLQDKSDEDLYKLFVTPSLTNWMNQ